MSTIFVLVLMLSVLQFDSSMLSVKAEVTDVGVSFSVPSGFYDEEFSLEMTAGEGADIYYTIDGSIPNNKSAKYDGVIEISDASANENVYSARTDTSVGYQMNDSGTGTIASYVVPDFKVDKCTVIRAVAQYSDGSYSEVNTATYFVQSHEWNSTKKVNVLSIVTDPDNLFDYDTGIYVLGKKYDDDPGNLPYWWWKNGNFRNKGIEWERKATLQFFDSNGDVQLIQDSGIRIHGGGTRGFAQKSFNLYARKEYDGNKKFQYNFFGNDYYPSKLTLSQGGDDVVCKSADYIVNVLSQDETNFSTMDMIPYALFLDGEYWGVYYLTEKYDDKYIEYHYDVDKDNVIMVKKGEIEEGEDTDISLWNDMKTYISNTDMSVEKNYQKASDMIDINSFIDYYATEMYIGRYNDWPESNYAAWRVKNVEQSKYGDGKWRWMLFDVNSGEMDNAQQDSISYVVSKDPVFASLLKNEDFQRKLVNKLMDIGNETYDNEKINNLINDMSQRMLPSLKETCRRFYGNEKESEISNTYVSRKNFFDNRKGYVISSCINNVDIAQEVASVSISVNDTVGGKVKVNSVYPTLDNEGKWTGEYFKDNAITLTAINKSGYVFVGWKGDVSSKEKTITCDLYNSNTSIEAIFVKDEELNGVPYIDMGEEGYTYLSSIPHVVINQVYGGGKKEAYSDYSFIELYNPTDKDVDLSTWSLLYKSSMDDIDYANAWQKVQLEGVIKSHTSYLIRCGSIKNPLENHISIKNYDFSWNQRINNKGFSLVLKADTNEVVADAQMFDNENKVPLISNYVDMVAVSGNEGLDTQAAPCYERNVSEVQSKKKTIRRVCFRDTDDNSVEGDFEVVDYSLLIPEYVKWISPKSSVDGEWTYKEEDEPKFTVKFNTNGADEIPDAEFAYLSKITEPKSLEKEGYTFTGWYIDEECTQPYDFNTYPTGDLTIFAGWSTNAYTISFDTNGGNELESLVVASDATIPELPNSTKDGYIFGGWYIDEDCTQRYDYVKMPAKNLLLFAKWEVSKYTVTFKNGDEVVKTETVEYGKCVTAPAVLIKEGYVFEG